LVYKTKCYNFVFFTYIVCNYLLCCKYKYNDTNLIVHLYAKIKVGTLKMTLNVHGLVTINCYGIAYNFEEFGSYVIQ